MLKYTWDATGVQSIYNILQTLFAASLSKGTDLEFKPYSINEATLNSFIRIATLFTEPVAIHFQTRWIARTQCKIYSANKRELLDSPFICIPWQQNSNSNQTKHNDIPNICLSIEEKSFNAERISAKYSNFASEKHKLIFSNKKRFTRVPHYAHFHKFSRSYIKIYKMLTFRTQRLLHFSRRWFHQYYYRQRTIRFMSIFCRTTSTEC